MRRAAVPQTCKTAAAVAATVRPSLHFTRTTLLSNRFIHTAVAFFVAGVALGIYMGVREDFRFTHVHAHLNLLGWVALGLIGLIYRLHPVLQAGALPRAQYWLHTVGLLLLMGGFAWGSATGRFQFVPVAAGASMVAAAVLLLAFNVFTRLRAPAPAGAVR